MKKFTIQPISAELSDAIQYKIDTKTKPIGALGQLETIANQICMVQQTTSPQLVDPHIYVFAADHGIAKEGVSNYPAEVTALMVLNFLSGGAAINVFCRQHALSLTIVDAGVNQTGLFPATHPNFIQHSIAKGTKNFLYESAMSANECERAIIQGAHVVDLERMAQSKCNVVGFGEMGISNTSSAAVIMHLITQLPLVHCVGRGTGLSDEALARKVSILQKAIANSPSAARTNPTSILAYFGGFEIAMMCGAMLQAAEQKQLVLVDGFIATSAFLVAHAMYPTIKEYAIFCHLSDENGHKLMLNFLNVSAILKLSLRLGEGTGCALAYPMLMAATSMMNEMASFDDLSNLSK